MPTQFCDLPYEIRYKILSHNILPLLVCFDTNVAFDQKAFFKRVIPLLGTTALRHMTMSILRSEIRNIVTKYHDDLDKSVTGFSWSWNNCIRFREKMLDSWEHMENLFNLSLFAPGAYSSALKKKRDMNWHLEIVCREIRQIDEGYREQIKFQGTRELDLGGCLRRVVFYTC